MKIKIIKTTDNKFLGMVFNTHTVEDLRNILVKDAGKFVDIKIGEKTVKMMNSNYTVHAKIINT